MIWQILRPFQIIFARTIRTWLVRREHACIWMYGSLFLLQAGGQYLSGCPAAYNCTHYDIGVMAKQKVQCICSVILNCAMDW